MASNTQETTFRRKTRAKNAGAKRKSRLQNHGTTPSFPVHTADADKNAPNEVSPVTGPVLA